MTLLRFVFCVFVLAGAQAYAAEANKDIDAFKQSFSARLAKVNPAFRIESVKPTDMPDFFQVQIAEGPLLYVKKDGDFMFTGTMYQMLNTELVNLSEKYASQARLALMDDMKKQDTIDFAPQGPVKTKKTIYVFTDVDCYYCQKLHAEVPEMNAYGIEVRYLAFPRAGIGSPSYNKIVSAWCADNRQDAITKLKNKETIPEASCENMVAEEYALGKAMGVNGTPAIVLEDGTLIPGYRPARDMAKTLGL